ncbi:MAG TPA: hypothetical protein VD763_03495 [Candidatus Saccharimonadales bacterium]|nr:hypothetical protein [Candidatus Saccharimonadales bacterium]
MLTSLLLTLAAVGSVTMSTVLHLAVPAPTGQFAVGRTSVLLMDAARDEPATPALDDHRRLRLVTWFPAVTGTGDPAPYVEDLDRIADGLIASGSIGSVEALGLGLVRDPARTGATPALAHPAPVVLLSPGNATNVGFYAALAEDLASHGFVVVGIDHPYQVAAVDLGDAVAVYAGDPPLDQASAVVPARIDERVADVGSVLDTLERDPSAIVGEAMPLDLTRIGIIGHSNGGVTAAVACADARLVACVNIDGQLAGGPLSARPGPAAPTKPFLYLTKETDLAAPLAALLEAGGPSTYRVVVPAAMHDTFGDGPMFRPRILPQANLADDVVTVARGVALAFFDHTLRDASAGVFRALPAPLDLKIEVYPLTAR